MTQGIAKTHSTSPPVDQSAGVIFVVGWIHNGASIHIVRTQGLLAALRLEPDGLSGPQGKAPNRREDRSQNISGLPQAYPSEVGSARPSRARSGRVSAARMMNEPLGGRPRPTHDRDFVFPLGAGVAPPVIVLSGRRFFMLL